MNASDALTHENVVHFFRENKLILAITSGWFLFSSVVSCWLQQHNIYKEAQIFSGSNKNNSKKLLNETEDRAKCKECSQRVCARAKLLSFIVFFIFIFSNMQTIRLYVWIARARILLSLALSSFTLNTSGFSIFFCLVCWMWIKLVDLCTASVLLLVLRCCTACWQLNLFALDHKRSTSFDKIYVISVIKMYITR